MRHDNRTHNLKAMKKSKGERENKRKIKGEACRNRTHDFLGILMEESKRKINEEACVNRTNNFLGRFKEENKRKHKGVGV